MKKQFTKPEIRFIKIQEHDIIATSGDMTKASLQSMEQEDW